VKTRVLAIGKLRERYVAEAAADFRARLRRYDPFEEVEVAASTGSGARSIPANRSGSWTTGDELSSLELAEARARRYSPGPIFAGRCGA